jgi:hypothetical protein
MNRYQSSVLEDGLDLALEAKGDLLDHDLRLSIEIALGFKFLDYFRTLASIVHPPDASACGAVRLLDEVRKVGFGFQFCPAANQASAWLWDAEVGKHLGESCLALQLRKFVECRHGEADLRSERVLYACEKERLFVRGE